MMPNPTRITTRNIICSILTLLNQDVKNSSVTDAFIVLEAILDPNCWVNYQ